MILLVCVIAMQTVLSAITNATSAAYQQKIFESNIGVDMEQVLHLDYRYTEESPEFANVIRQYLDYIKELPGVQAVGQLTQQVCIFPNSKTWTNIEQSMVSY